MPEFPEIPLGRGKIFIPLGDGTEMMDTLYPIFRLREEGYEPVVSGPEARLYNGVMHEIPPGESVRWDITREQPSYHVRATIAFRDARPDDYVGLFLSGGRAPEYLRYDKHLMDLVRAFFAANKPVAMVCHGVELAAAAGCLKNRTATTVAKCELDITSFGGHYVDKPCVVDGNLVSGRTWHDNPFFLPPFIQMLNAAHPR